MRGRRGDLESYAFCGGGGALGNLFMKKMFLTYAGSERKVHDAHVEKITEEQR